jgi:TRAP transporter TAXI family solute receptor
VVATGGSLDNANLVAAREVDMGILTQVDAMALYDGTGAWKGEPFRDLRIITPLIPGHVRIVVQAGSNINTLADLKGKRFSPGQMGGGESTFRDIWTACGFSYGDLRIEYLDMNGMVDAMKDGKIDGCFFAGSEPYAALMDLKTSMGGKVKIYSFTDDEVKMILAAVPRYAPWVSKAGTYPNQNYDATIIAYHYYLGTTSDLPADLAYDACKGLNEQQKWLSSIHAGYVNLDIEKAPGIMGMTDIPIHEGALKYWKEVGAIK